MTLVANNNNSKTPSRQQGRILASSYLKEYSYCIPWQQTRHAICLVGGGTHSQYNNVCRKAFHSHMAHGVSRWNQTAA